MTKKCIVAFDTDQIKQYVFATDALKEIRGASALLDELNRIDMDKIIYDLDNDRKLIYANGGSGMFVVDSEKAKAILEEVQRAYWEKTNTSSITGVIQELPESWQDLPDPAQKEIRQVSYKLRIAKEKNRDVTTILAHSLFKDCDACHLEYATQKVKQAGQEEEWLCESCQKKRAQSQSIAEKISDLMKHPGKLKPEDDEDVQELWPRLLSTLKDTLQGRHLERPQDTNQLGDLSLPRNYIGLIYADGNDMGKQLEEMNSLAELQKFSKAVDTAIYKALEKAIAEHLLPSGKQTVFPFDVLLWGGDDLIMLTTAQQAINTAITVAREFHEQTKTFDPQGLSLSVSVVLTHAKFPFNTAFTLAEQALKFAKTGYAKKSRENPELPLRGVINFMVVNSSSSLQFKDIYKHELYEKNPVTGEKLYRTLRPYALEQLEAFQEQMQATLHHVPKTKLNQLRDAVTQDRQNAMLATFATLVRAKDRDKAYITKFIEHFAADPTQVEYPWYRVQKEEGDEYYTPLLDAIELYEFIKRGGSA